MRKLLLHAVAVMLLATDVVAQNFKLNAAGCFGNGGDNVMVFSDVYPKNHQGEVTLVKHKMRKTRTISCVVINCSLIFRASGKRTFFC